MKNLNSNKKISSGILVTVLFLVIGFTTMSMKPLFKNKPLYHSTLGTIPPIDYTNYDPPTTVWTFINTTGCGVGVTTWLTGAINGGPTSDLYIDFPIGTSNLITSGNVLGLFGVTGTDILTISKISFQFYIIGGTGGEKAIYPINGKYRWSPTGATGEGCGCLDFEVDEIAKTVRVEYCNP